MGNHTAKPPRSGVKRKHRRTPVLIVIDTAEQHGRRERDYRKLLDVAELLLSLIEGDYLKMREISNLLLTLIKCQEPK